MSVTSVIVTFNRKNDVIRCLNANIRQTKKMDNILIIDNASTDNTIKAIFDYFALNFYEIKKEQKVLLTEIEGRKIWIVAKERNTGGSGGFYTGLKTAHEEFNSDYYWMMDDDGYPSENCLESLMKVSDKYDYVMPTSIDIDNHEQLSWATRMRNGKKTIKYSELMSSWGDIMDFVTPFNGVLLSKKCVSDVGYINKDFFIWGDEYEHWWRCKEHNIYPVTLLNAKFYHPAAKLPLVPICGGLFKVPYADSKLRMCCLARNYTYIYLHHDKKIKILIKYLMYMWLFLITRKGDFSGWKLYRQSVKDGFKGDFTRHLQYLK